jgi:hypothetical protein
MCHDGMAGGNPLLCISPEQIMTFEEFLKRARAAGCTIEQSGAVTFITHGPITVRHNLHSGLYYLKRESFRADSDFIRTNVEGASRALHLPRK